MFRRLTYIGLVFFLASVMPACAPEGEEATSALKIIEDLTQDSWELTPSAISALNQSSGQGSSPQVGVLNDQLTLIGNQTLFGEGWIERDMQLGPQTIQWTQFVNYEAVGTNGLKVMIKYLAGEEASSPAAVSVSGDTMSIQGGNTTATLYSSPILYTYNKIPKKTKPQITTILENSDWGLKSKEMLGQGPISPAAGLIVRMAFIKNASGQMLLDLTMDKGTASLKYCYGQSYTLNTVAKELTLTQSNPSNCGQSSSWNPTSQDLMFEIPYGQYRYSIQDNKLRLEKLNDPAQTIFTFEINSFQTVI